MWEGKGPYEKAAYSSQKKDCLAQMCEEAGDAAVAGAGEEAQGDGAPQEEVENPWLLQGIDTIPAAHLELIIKTLSCGKMIEAKEAGTGARRRSRSAFRPLRVQLRLPCPEVGLV